MNLDAFSVLLVEDDPSYAGLVTTMIASAQPGVRVVHAASLAAALDAVKSEAFSAALIDLGLPDARGLHSVDEIRRALPSLPVIVLTSHDDPELASRALRAGAQDYILKPDVDAPLLLRALRYAVERWRVQEILRESERRYRFLFERSPLPMWVYDVESLRFLAVNEAAIRSYGFTRDEFLSMTILDIRPPEDAPRVRRAAQLAVGLSRSATWRHRRKDGTLLEALVTSHWLNFGGRDSRLVLAEDVTERMAAERRLHFLSEAGSLLGGVDLAASLDGVTALAARTISDVASIVLVDEAGEVEQVHVAHRDLDTQRQLSAVGEALRQRQIRLPPAYEAVMHEGRTAIAQDVSAEALPQFMTADAARIVGARVHSVMIVPLRRGDRIRGVVSFVYLDAHRSFGPRDRVVAEDLANRLVLAIENARLYREARELFDADLTANFIASADGPLLDCNGTFARMLRFPDVATACRGSAVDVFGGAERWSDFIGLVTRERDMHQREIELNASDGTRVQVLASAAGLFDDRGRLLRLRGQCYDLTAHKQLEAQFSQSQKIEAIGRLAGGIAHDFNNLLTLIRGQVEKLQSGLQAGDPLRRSANEVARAADRAAGLTQQLLAFSRRQVLTPKVLSVNSVVENVHTMLTRVLGEDVTFELSLAAEILPVRADPGRLEQALLNLAINARDAMPDGGVLSISTANVDIDEAYCRQHISARPGSYVRLAVSDTGAGMDAETRERAFEPFFTTKELGKGTGLGLSTVYGTVKQSGGYIWIYSEPGIGTTFKIYLPVVDAPFDAEARPAVPTDPARLKGTETILLVEDEDGVREVIEDTLTARGYRVLAASRGPEALQIAEFVDGDIHLLVTDVVMPQMSGREVALRLTARRPEMRVLYLSGYTDDAILHHGILEPGAAFLQKPFAAAELARKVREVLGASAR
jgi:PAS domain S-box-containing protein